MDPLALLALVLFLAFVIETLVEAIFSPVFEKVPKLTPYKWLLMYIAIAVGLTGAFLYQLDIIHLLSVWLKLPDGTIPITPYGITLTGLAIGKGSNYIHELIKKYLMPKPVPTQ